MDLALYAVILLLFAVWSTLHLLLCFRLRVTGLRRALLAFIVVPLAPVWGRKAGLAKLSFSWIVFAVGYFLSLLAGLSG